MFPGFVPVFAFFVICKTAPSFIPPCFLEFLTKIFGRSVKS